jgi:hypothetical protein
MLVLLVLRIQVFGPRVAWLRPAPKGDVCVCVCVCAVLEHQISRCIYCQSVVNWLAVVTDQGSCMCSRQLLWWFSGSVWCAAGAACWQC